MGFCRKCGSQLPEDAEFCSRCGTPVAIAVPPPSPPLSPSARSPHPQQQTSPQPKRRAPWWIAPAAVVGLVLLAWLLLAGLPFGREEPRPAARPETETIAEAPPPSGTLVEVPPGVTDDSFEIATTTTQEPPMSTAPPNVTATTPPPTATAAPPVVRTQPQRQPPPVVRTQPQRQPPVVVRTQPQPPPAALPRPQPPRAELTAAEATATLRNYVRSTRYYGVAAECIRVENNGYRNVGYDLEVWHSCPGSSGGARRLGRWRVDSKTREVFRQRDDGRYLRP